MKEYLPTITSLDLNVLEVDNSTLDSKIEPILQEKINLSIL